MRTVSRGLGIAQIERKCDEGIGSKFADADLTGIPVRVTVGSRGLSEGNVEVKLRADDDHTLVPVEEAADHVRALVAEGLE